MAVHHYLACDLGAESGRVIIGTIEDGRLSLREVHRFPNVPLRENNSLVWNAPNLIVEIKEGLRKASATGLPFAGISTDSWGVDYILFDHAEAMMPPVYHYRDARTKRGSGVALSKVTRAEIFSETGIQHMPINTIFQLAAEDPARLRKAKFLLGVGDAVNFFLSGTPKMEVSMASTFQLFNPRTHGWSQRLISRLGFPQIFPEIVASGSTLGKVRPELAAELNFGQPPEVIATCSHDTGAAVAGVPASGGSWAYLSSGTWSLMGVELREPIINEKACELNFTNEIGFRNSVRLLKNISGLWLIQECRREWAAQGREFDYGTLTRLASEAKPFRSLINPASEEFLAPANMPSQIAEFCRQTGQTAPETEAHFTRCCYESLALLYRWTLKQLEELTGARIEHLHIVGGGSHNDLLNQFTANATGVPVFAGPAEATAAGNVVIQALALGHLPDLSAARELIRQSMPVRKFEPRDRDQWDRAYERFADLARN